MADIMRQSVTRYRVPETLAGIPRRNRWGSVCRSCGVVVPAYQGRILKGEPRGRAGHAPWIPFCDACVMPRVRMGASS